KGTTYVSTLAVYEQRGRYMLTPLLAAVMEPAVRDAFQSTSDIPNSTRSSSSTSPQAIRWQHLMHNIAALHAAGIPLGTGTDAGVTGTHHGWATLRELQLLVAGGLKPLEAITAATGNSAKAIKVDAERGTIAPGKLADLVLIEGAPHKNIADIERVRRVFLGGREI